MEVVLIAMVPPAGGTAAVGTALVTDILWANSKHEDFVEHISVHPDPGGSGLVIAGLFFRPAALRARSAPDAAGLRICRRAIVAAPVLTGWQARQLRFGW